MGGSLMQMLQQYGQQFQGGGGGNLGGALGLPNGAPMQLRGGGGGYAQPMRRYDPDFGDPRRAQGTGGGGAVSAPDGSVSYAGGATSPFEVGGNSGGGGFRWPAWMGPAPQNQLYGSGGPISAGNGYGAGQLPGIPGLNFPPGMTVAQLQQSIAALPPRNPGGVELYGNGPGGYQGPPPGGPPPGGYGQGDAAPRQPQQPYRGREGDPRDIGNGHMAGGMPPWVQRRNPGTRDDQRRAYWDRGMNDTGRGGEARPGPVGGYWQRPMGRGPMPGQGVPLGGGGREMPNPGGVPQTQGGMIKSANPGQSQVYNPQGGGPVSLTPAQPQQQVRRVTRDDPQARGWSGYA